MDKKSINQLQEGMKIRFNVTEGDWATFMCFSSLGEYKLYTLQSAYPGSKLENPNELIIWCDEVGIHTVSSLNPAEWEVVDTHGNFKEE